VFTTNLLLADYAVAVSGFMLAAVAALVVGKAVLVANAITGSLSSLRAQVTVPAGSHNLYGRGEMHKTLKG
jgi:hypothetical protein